MADTPPPTDTDADRPHIEGGPAGRPFRFAVTAPCPAAAAGGLAPGWDAPREELCDVPHSPDPPSPTEVALKGCCPRCGRGRLFKGYLSLAPRCEACGLDYGFIDTADGPAFFVMSIVGIVVVALALWVEFAYEPPIWLHLVLWFGLTGILSLALVRPLKALMVALQFHNRAEEGRLEK
jgi:uncharacterized protein (DUF983 family)